VAAARLGRNCLCCSHTIQLVPASLGDITKVPEFSDSVRYCDGAVFPIIRTNAITISHLKSSAKKYMQSAKDLCTCGCSI